MLSTIREMNGLNMNDNELAQALVDTLPCDNEGALFWA